MAHHEPHKSLMNSLGSFFGHIWKGIRTDPAAPSPPTRRVVKTDTEHEVRDTPQGRVVIRRTTIEEVEIPRPERPLRHPDSPHSS